MLYTIILSIVAIIYVRQSFSIESNEIEQYGIQPNGDVVNSVKLEQFVYDKLNTSCSKKPDNNVNTENELKQIANIQQPKFDLAPIIHRTRLTQMENIGHTEKVWKLKNLVQTQHKLRRQLTTLNENANSISKVASEVIIDNGTNKPDGINDNYNLLQNNINVNGNMNGNIQFNEYNDGNINSLNNDKLEESNNAFTVVTETIGSENLQHFLTYNGNKCKNISIAIKDAGNSDDYSFYSQNQVMEVIKVTNHTRIPMLNGQFDVRAKQIIPIHTILGVYCGDMYLEDEFYDVFENSCQFGFRRAYYFGAQAYYNKKTFKLLIDAIAHPSNPLLYVNDCRQNIHQGTRTEDDLRAQNTQYIGAWIDGFPQIYLLSTKVICKGCSVVTYYGEKYSWSYSQD